jgi:NAD(P)-dependent dehydrogenase (short-subunit alcohol dehydrogenase family)
MGVERRHAVVTGGGRGIGAAIAEALARAGVDVTIMGRAAAALDEHADRLRRDHGIRATAITVDITDEYSVDAAFAGARAEIGEIHILVNNAGQAGSSSFLDISRDAWDRMFAVNVTGALLCTQRVLPAMLETRAGRIVNVASTAGLRGVARIAPYCASKHALIGLTRSLAIDVAQLGVTVNAVCPGYTEGAMAQRAVATLVKGTGKSAEEALKMMTRPSALRRLVRPEEVAAMVVWLCSAEASAITGQAIVLGGEII